MEDLQTQTRELREDGAKAYRRLLGWDLLFPFLYGPALFQTLCWATSVHGITVAPWKLAIVPALVALFDWIENGVLLSQTRASLVSPSPGAINVASMATRAKIAGYSLCILVPPLSWIVRKLWECLPF